MEVPDDDLGDVKILFQVDLHPLGVRGEFDEAAVRAVSIAIGEELQRVRARNDNVGVGAGDFLVQSHVFSALGGHESLLDLVFTHGSFEVGHIAGRDGRANKHRLGIVGLDLHLFTGRSCRGRLGGLGLRGGGGGWRAGIGFAAGAENERGGDGEASAEEEGLGLHRGGGIGD